MNQISIVLGFLIIFSYLKITLASTLEDIQYQEFNLTTVEIIKKFGYPAETHTTETEDGYILEMHRIPHGKNSTKPGFPILLQHGLFLDSSTFLLFGSDSPAFLLSDAGYDIWLGNSRGNPYTMKHKNLSPEDHEFWDFSWHESGVYDLPAQIDYICNRTKFDKILYLGYSMGTTVYFVMASERPEYETKIKGAIMLAPVVYVNHIRSPLRYPASIIQQIPEAVLNEINISTDILNLYCGTDSDEIKLHICKELIFSMAGRGSEEFDERGIKNYFAHISPRSSLKYLTHYGQNIVSGKFCQYDHGLLNNLAKYNQLLPPNYKLESITTPMSLFLGQNDLVVDSTDLDKLLHRVSCVKSIDVIPYKFFNHMDFIAAKHRKTLLYDTVIERIKSFLN